MDQHRYIEKYAELLRENPAEAIEKLPPKERQAVERLNFILREKIEDMTITDRELYEKITQKYRVSFPQFLRDVSIVERIIGLSKYGNMDPQKAWVRYFIFESLKQAMRLAQEEGDGYKMAYIANMIGKHYLTDREDAVQIDYSIIRPFVPEITSDPSVLGIQPIPDRQEKIIRLAEKYGIDYEPIPGVKITTQKKSKK